MPLSVHSVHPAMRYPTETITRAERAMRCSPFNLTLFQRMQAQSVALQAIAGTNGVQQHYTSASLSELAVERDLLWLIQVGLLRREVDGQGLTDCFRLTPLGRLLVEKWEVKGGQVRAECQDSHNQTDWHAVNWQDHALNFFSRWLRIPIL